MKAFILIFILLTSPTYADTCTDYFHPFRITRVEDLSEAEYDNLETIARLELADQVLTNPHLKNSRLSEIRGHLQNVLFYGIDLRVYWEIQDIVAKNQSLKERIYLKQQEGQHATLRSEYKLKQEIEKHLLAVLSASNLNEVLLKVFDPQYKSNVRKRILDLFFGVPSPWFNRTVSFDFSENIRAETLNQALVRAVETEDLHAFRTLLNHGAKIETKDSQGNTVLHLAAKSEYFHRFREYMQGFDFQAKNIFGETALHSAVRNDKPSVISTLLSLGIKIDEVDIKNETALHHAARYYKKTAVRDLLKYGASTETVNSAGQTPPQLANNWWEIAEIFREHEKQIRKANRKPLKQQIKQKMKKLKKFFILSNDSKNKDP